MFKKADLNRLLAVSLAVLALAACGATPTATPATNTPAPAATQAPAQPTKAEAAQPTAAPIEPTRSTSEGQAPTEVVQPTAAPVVEVKKFNLNTMTREEILSIPNTGNRMVREFDEYRPYTSILQFRKEIGKYVNAAQVAEYEKYVYVPISPNNADAATLQQLPGVTAIVAGQIIAARPFNSKDDFVKKLGELTSPTQAAAVAFMVEAQ
jgi:DNA uptake protein ComE-like DNA-binding protein